VTVGIISLTMMAILAAFQTVIMRDRTCVRFPEFLVEASVVEATIKSLSQMFTWFVNWQND
tara:strand:+ start:7406 stop:7588 length:183 start_codon:yes stop_codon:yes gene_type:complete